MHYLHFNMKHQRLIVGYQPGGGGTNQPVYMNTTPGGGTHVFGLSRPTTSNSQYTQDDDRTSFESRSLAGYSHMSGVAGGGRDASMDRDFRPGFGGASRANPFVHGSTLNREADDVVQMFLANNHNGNRQPGKVEDLPSPTGAFGQQQVINNLNSMGNSYLSRQDVFLVFQIESVLIHLRLK